MNTKPKIEIGHYIECDFHSSGTHTRAIYLMTVAGVEEGQRLLADPPSGWRKTTEAKAQQLTPNP